MGGQQVFFSDEGDDFLGFFLHYDFITNQFLNFGANSLGAGWIHDDDRWEAAAHISFVAIGGTDCLQLKIYDLMNGEPEEERRSYDLSLGVNLKTSSSFIFPGFGSITFDNSFYHLNIIPGSIPDGGSGGITLVNYLSLDFRKTITPDISIMLLASTYSKISGYDILHDISEHIVECRLGIVFN